MRWSVRIIAAVVVVAVLSVVGMYLTVRASLPALDGTVSVASLDQAVTIERDALGVATIVAPTRRAAAFATGFVHAQERFFQMDLQRRAGAGELAALLGPALVDTDKSLRLHRFRARARAMAAELPAATSALYSAYVDGVNAGLAALGARPFEYLLLNAQPQAWEVEDILLTVFSMWFELDDETAERESELGLLREMLPASVYDWLIQSGTDWDAPLRGGPPAPAPMPDATQFDLRNLPSALFTHRADDEPERFRPHHGSNNWAVAASASATGHAIVAGDMHLGHAVPNIWFRARLVVAPEDLDIAGVMLSGTPLIVAGSNGHIAWAYTNSYGDWQDLVVLHTDEAVTRYRTPDGWQPFVEHREVIEVRGAPPVEFSIRETVWGPVVGSDHRGRLRAVRWLAHSPEASNANIQHFERVRSLDEAIEAANHIGIPPQNVLIADRDGRIGWTIMGRIPRRVGVDPAWPSDWSDGRGWLGWIAPRDYPRIVDPPLQRLWSANARTVDGDWLALIGEGDYPTGARPRQIREALLAREQLTIADMLDIQLDERALFLRRWQRLMLDVLDDDAVHGRPQRAELRRLVRDWGARAAVESVGYRFVRAFRNQVIAAVTAAITAPVRAQLPDFELTHHSQLERPVWQALRRRPAHLLDPRFDGWDAMLLSVIDGLIDYYDNLGETLASRTWGELNTADIAHPIARASPLLARWLNMPRVPLPGGSDMPRVQTSSFGASQRMAVSPGREHEGYFHMPAGQSGHPLSPFYGAGHEDWLHGKPSPFLPGAPRHRLVLQPR